VLYVLPHPLDHARVVVAVGKIMAQRGEAVHLARSSSYHPVDHG
jgi:hypothetical protein